MPPLAIAAQVVLSSAPAHVLPHCERTLTLLAIAGIGPEHLSVPFAQLLVRTATAVLASLAAGEVPPLTFPGRFARLDDHLARVAGPSPRRVVDVGCGFPPFTSLELAARIPSAEVIAIDPALPATEGTLPDGTRAFFDETGRFRFALANGELVVKEEPPGEVERRATDWLARHGDALRDPLASHAGHGVRFIRARAGDASLDAALSEVDAIRAMNVLFYLPPDEREAFFAWAARVLKEDGALLEGASFLAGTELRFVVHRKRGGVLRAVETGFSIDCVRSFGPFPWMELHGDPGPERLAHLVGTVRRDPSFQADFDRFLDAELERHGVLVRSPDGTLTALAPLSPPALGAALSAIALALDAAGFTERAASVLRAAGLDASRGEPTHVLVRLDE